MSTRTRASTAAIAAVLLSATAHGEGNEIQFSKARMYIEFNSSANDIGIQVLLDGDQWRNVTMYTPDERTLLDIVARRGIRQQGLSELFFESAEPSLDEVSLEVFLGRFPEGTYEFEGMTVEGVEIEGEAQFTHVIPAGPEIVQPVSATEDPPVVDPGDAVIEWSPVTETFDGSSDIEIKGYQVIVEQVEPARTYMITLPADATEVEVPEEFFEQRDTLHKFEVLAIEVGGNQTITEGEFLTAP
jgi:hypothetical protein